MTTVPLAYHLCPRCFRATPAVARERFCPNDGATLLTACPRCRTPIASPYSRFCTACGRSLDAAEESEKTP